MDTERIKRLCQTRARAQIPSIETESQRWQKAEIDSTVSVITNVEPFKKVQGSEEVLWMTVQPVFWENVNTQTGQSDEPRQMPCPARCTRPAR